VHFSHPALFDIPDSVWTAAGTRGWRPATQSYVASAYRDALSGNPHEDLPVKCVPLDLIVPPVRTGGAPWFVDERMLRALHGMVAGDPVPAVLGQRENDDPAALVQIVDGMHRFYASAALGFTHLPVAIRPWFA
jgi:hypothetical protein